MLGKTIGKIYVMEHTTVFDFVYYPTGTFGLELFTPHQNKIYFNIETLVNNASSWHERVFKTLACLPSCLSKDMKGIRTIG